jgi:hypothetical protein
LALVLAARGGMVSQCRLVGSTLPLTVLISQRKVEFSFSENVSSHALSID